ncbi:MAG: prolipoprotein diacylglyceryl transferase [Nannocystaceae bacterium]
MANSTTHSHDLEKPTGLLGFFRNLHNQTILFRAGDWIFVTYGLLAGLAFVVGQSTAFWYFGVIGANPVQLAAYYTFFLTPMVLMGARLASIMLEWRQLFKKPLQTLVKPGYMLHGGVFGGMLAAVGISQLTGVGLLVQLDALGICVTIGEAVCRLGCYVYGCCWGKPTQSKLGVAYTSEHSKVLRCCPDLKGVKIHPAQLYALLAHLVQFTLFYLLLPYKVFDGMFAALYLITHPIIRVIMERFRQDDRGKLIGPLTHTNLYSGIQVLLGLAVLSYGLATSSAASNLSVNMQVGLFSSMTDTALLPYLGITFVAAILAYGVHYKQVGSWVHTRSEGMHTQVDEMSMGAAARADGRDDD